MKPILSILSLCLMAASVAAYPLYEEPSLDDIGRTTERELKVTLSSDFGSIMISRGESEKIVVATEGAGQREPARVTSNYTIRNRVGYLDIVLGDQVETREDNEHVVHVGDLKSGKWYLAFTDAVPISFDIELGVGKGEFDLTGIQVKDFNLTAGASNVALYFNESNKTSIDNMNIESGVSKFVGRNLGNANFKRFRFQGGVGSYELDFSGQLMKEVDVDVDVGMGAVTIYIPEQIGVKMFHEASWISKMDCGKGFEKVSESEYTTENFSTARGKMNLRVTSGVGAVKIRRK